MKVNVPEFSTCYDVKFSRKVMVLNKDSKLGYKFVEPSQNNGSHCIVTIATTCRIINAERKTVGIGQAVCDTRDNFSKEKGRKTALARALKVFAHARTKDMKIIRKHFWDIYRDRKNPE